MSVGPFEYFSYKKGGNLTAEDVPLSRIAEATGTPVYVYSAAALLESFGRLQTALAPLDHLICFAVKSNSNLAVLRLLGDVGAGMDVVSGGELERALKAGVSANRIIFSGVGKTAIEISQALACGILSFNVESIAELSALNAIAESMGKSANVALRFNPDVDPQTHPHITTGRQEHKFGLTRAEILDLARELAKQPENFAGISIQGLSLHIGSQVLKLKPFEQAFKKLHDLIIAISKILPKPIQLVDVGGGLGVSYGPETAPSIIQYARLVSNYFGPKSGLPGQLKIVLEPGRLISANAGVLLTSVIYKKRRPQKDFIIVDAAMNDLIRVALYGSHHEIIPLKKAQLRGPKRKTDVVGPVCETSDAFTDERKIPSAIVEGDLLAIMSAGAYGFSMSSNYNSRPRPPEVLISKGDFTIIRSRENLDDLWRGEVIEL